MSDDVVYHFTDSLHLPWIVESGELRPYLNCLRGIGDINYLWATTKLEGDKTARALIDLTLELNWLEKIDIGDADQEDLYAIGKVVPVRFTLPPAGFVPWSAIKRRSSWTKQQVEELEAYIMNWLAWAVQNPDRQAEVALVFKGKRGVGKGTLGNVMLRIFSQHGVHISNSDHLTGHFNNHLRDACYLFADEAYWPGDKKAEGNLKRLVTEPTLFIEGKGRDGISMTNMLHVIIASNENWVVPAGERERRYVMLDVPDIHIQDAKWFEPIYAELENGGYAAMLHDLLHHDLGDWHPRQLPKDTGLLDQQVRSLPALDAWWLELIESGRLSGCDPDHPARAVSNGYDKAIDVGGDYPRFVKQDGLFDQARKLVPQLRQHTTDHELGRHLGAQGCSNEKKVMRKQGWWFPPLLECRAAWMERFPNWKWRNALTEWQPEEADDEPLTLEELKDHAEKLEKKTNGAKAAVAAHLRYEQARRKLKPMPPRRGDK